IAAHSLSHVWNVTYSEGSRTSKVEAVWPRASAANFTRFNFYFHEHSDRKESRGRGAADSYVLPYSDRPFGAARAHSDSRIPTFDSGEQSRRQRNRGFDSRARSARKKLCAGSGDR